MEVASANSGGNYKPAPAGMHRAICYRFVDLGTQETTYKGQNKHTRKVMLSFELSDALDEFEYDGRIIKKPYAVHSRFTWSMSEKGHLRPFLESWRGKPFSDDDLAAGGFDTKRLIGVPCYLNVIHEERDGRKYANIRAITPLPSKLAEDQPPMANDGVYIALQEDRFDEEAFKALHERLQDTIKQSPEYRDIMGLNEASDGSNPPAPPNDDDMDDEIPF